MSQFDQIVKNIVLENEKCGYNPEEDTNWSKLTKFLQNECVRRMDVKTKIRLSQSCETERRRVDTKSLKWEYVAEKIASITEKSDYNPAKDMNWDILPMEMRNECVKHMDFKTRCCFRRVSKTERALIDFKTYRFEWLYISFDGENWEVFASTKKQKWEIKTIPKRFPDYGCIAAILKHAELKKFSLVTENEAKDYETAIKHVIERIVKLGPFRFEWLDVYNNPFIDLLMKNCENLKEVEFDVDSYQFPYKEILELPLTMKINGFKFSWVTAEDFLECLMEHVQKWIDNDVGVGKSVQFHMQTRGVIDGFAEKFADRIIEKNDEIVRIRMNNETTQVLLRFIGFKFEDEFGEQEFCSCKVIPIDSPESEYGNGDEWIQKNFDQF